jgi:hypothetical protein
MQHVLCDIRGDWCTFETFAHLFGIGDSAVERLAAIVHDVDLKVI